MPLLTDAESKEFDKTGGVRLISGFESVFRDR